MDLPEPLLQALQCIETIQDSPPEIQITEVPREEDKEETRPTPRRGRPRGPRKATAPARPSKRGRRARKHQD